MAFISQKRPQSSWWKGREDLVWEDEGKESVSPWACYFEGGDF